MQWAKVNKQGNIQSFLVLRPHKTNTLYYVDEFNTDKLFVSTHGVFSMDEFNKQLESRNDLVKVNYDIFPDPKY